VRNGYGLCGKQWVLSTEKQHGWQPPLKHDTKMKKRLNFQTPLLIRTVDIAGSACGLLPQLAQLCLILISETVISHYRIPALPRVLIHEERH
jgi:hypothetical protein